MQRVKHVRKFCRKLKKDSAEVKPEVDHITKSSSEGLFTVVSWDTPRKQATLSVNKSRKGRLLGHYRYDKETKKYILNKPGASNKLSYLLISRLMGTI